jgi:hypothetical protein
MTEAKGCSDGDFKNHGERTRTMVELPKRLGYGARVGAHQANFGSHAESRNGGLVAHARDAQGNRSIRSPPFPPEVN